MSVGREAAACVVAVVGVVVTGRPKGCSFGLFWPPLLPVLLPCSAIVFNKKRGRERERESVCVCVGKARLSALSLV